MSSSRRPKKIRRDNSRGLLPLLGVVILASAILLAAGMNRARAMKTGSETGEAETAAKNVNDEDIILVPAPTRNIAKGEKLSAVQFTSIKWPKSRLTTDYLLESNIPPHITASTPLPKYLPIPLAALNMTQSEGNQVTERIPQGMRAITVRVDAESAVEGWAQSGNFVDVILVRSSKDSIAGLESKVIAENVRILSAGRSSEPLNNDSTAPTPPSTVTLLVNQEDALKIKTGANLGKLTFALRGSGDQLPTTTTRVDQRTLLGIPKTMSSTQQVTGTARGPDGQFYILSKGAQWVRDQSGEKSPPSTSEGEQ